MKDLIYLERRYGSTYKSLITCIEEEPLTSADLSLGVKRAYRVYYISQWEGRTHDVHTNAEYIRIFQDGRLKPFKGLT